MNTCNACPAKWSGNNRAHCYRCHETTSVTYFDKHQQDDSFGDRVCIPFGELGLHQNEKGVWVSDYTGPGTTDD